MGFNGECKGKTWLSNTGVKKGFLNKSRCVFVSNRSVGVSVIILINLFSSHNAVAVG